MLVNRAELQTILQAVKPGVEKKEVVEQMTHILFTGSAVATYNDRVCVMYPFECDFAFSVKEEDFSKIIDNIAEETLELSLVDDMLLIKSKKTKAKLSTVVDEKAKIAHLIDQLIDLSAATDFYKPLPLEFIEAVTLCSFSANKDSATGVKACVAVKGDTAYSTDSIRCSLYVMDGDMPEILLPAKDVMTLIRYNVSEFGLSKNWAHFRTGEGVTFCCKVMKGDYLYDQIARIFSDDDPTLKFPEELGEQIASVVSLAAGEEDINKSVDLEVQPGIITIRAEKERGWIEKEVDIEYDGEAFKFSINPIFFSQILKHATNFTLLKGKVQFSSDNFYHVLALPRAKG